MGSGTRAVRPARNDPGEVRTIRTIFATVLRDLPTYYAEIEAALSRISVPTLVAWGTRDPFFSAEHGRRTAALIPTARFVPYEGAGHFVPIERPDSLAADIRALLAT